MIPIPLFSEPRRIAAKVEPLMALLDDLERRAVAGVTGFLYPASGIRPRLQPSPFLSGPIPNHSSAAVSLTNF